MLIFSKLFTPKQLTEKEFKRRGILLWIYAILWFVSIYAVYIWSITIIPKFFLIIAEIFLVPDMPGLTMSYKEYIEKFNLDNEKKKL
ncbi:MAG: hypothetical protein HY960_07875 [Ignavibacteriae bacterium]|nr:hypothetical protein [Ignavibacteriota bacterium]